MGRASDTLLQESIEQLDEPSRWRLAGVLDYPLIEPKYLANRLRVTGSNSFVSEFRANGGVSFVEVLDDVIAHLQAGVWQWPRKAITDEGLTLDEMDERARHPELSKKTAVKFRQYIRAAVITREGILLESFLGRAYEQLTPEAKAEFDSKVRKESENTKGPSLVGVGGAAAAMAVASAGGFGTYMAMSSAIHALTLGAAGFGVYTTASSLAGIILGPVGWTALGLTAVLQLTGPKMKRLVPAVAAVVMHDAQSEEFWRIYRLNRPKFEER